MKRPSADMKRPSAAVDEGKFSDRLKKVACQRFDERGAMPPGSQQAHTKASRADKRSIFPTSSPPRIMLSRSRFIMHYK